MNGAIERHFEAACVALGVDPEAMRSRSRHRATVAERRAVWRWMWGHNLPGHSLPPSWPEIGAATGHSHSTVIEGLGIRKRFWWELDRTSVARLGSGI